MRRQILAPTLLMLLAGLLFAGCTTKSGYRVGPAIPLPSSGQIPIK